MRLQVLLVVALGLVDQVQSRAVAQTPPAPAAGAIEGRAYDSLLVRGPLRNATIYIVGTPLSTNTDPRGRFAISGAPEGDHILTFSHPAFDSAGVQAPQVVSALGLLIAATTADAQQSNGQGRAIIAGTVFDSLVKNAPLPGAEVAVDGLDRAATTAAKGHFRIEGVPAGRAIVRFYHPSLDSLGFGAPPLAVAVPDSGTVNVRLATPSPARLRATQGRPWRR